MKVMTKLEIHLVDVESEARRSCTLSSRSNVPHSFKKKASIVQY